MELSNVLFIDIETVSQYPAYSYLDKRWKLLFEKKMKYFFEKEPQKTASQFYEEKAGIYAEFGKVICIGLGFFHKDQLRIKTIYGEDEEFILHELFSLITQHFGHPEKQLICGHNIREFDIPFLCRRAAILGLQLPSILNISNKKPWEVRYIADTLEMWKFGDLKNYISLDLLAACLGLEGSKEDMDGSEVGNVYYIQKDLKRIADYCARDVWVTCNVALRLQSRAAVPFEEVHFADTK
jgi:3'-5' exonuclease